MKKAKMMIAGLAAALTLTFASGHAMAQISALPHRSCSGYPSGPHRNAVEEEIQKTVHRYATAPATRTARFHATAPVIRTAQIRAAAMAMATAAAADRETGHPWRR